MSGQDHVDDYLPGHGDASYDVTDYDLELTYKVEGNSLSGKAKLTCVDPAKLDKSFAGRDFDLALLESLPARIDPCGENGEFHTFVHDAPVFDWPIDVQNGEIVERDGFVFADVLEA